MENLTTNNKKRFTTLIDNDLLSQIKLISYFTNQKLNEVINSSLQTFISNFEEENNTTISSIINLQSKFNSNNQSIKEDQQKDSKK